MSLVLSVWFVTFVQWLLETRTRTLSCRGGSHLQQVLHLPSLSEALFTQGHLSLELTAGSCHLTGDTALSSKSPSQHPVTRELLLARHWSRPATSSPPRVIPGGIKGDRTRLGSSLLWPSRNITPRPAASIKGNA